MLISEDNRSSRLATCIDAAHHYQLSPSEAIELMEAQLRCIGEHWPSVCDEGEVSAAERNFFWGRQILNPYAFTALEGNAASLATLADEIRTSAG